MTLAFPNPSRSFDQTRRAVCFIGHDGMFQVRFFVEVEVLGTFGDDGGKERAEMAYLSAFDALRSSIQDAASKAYARERRNSYTLTASGFR
ncbi:DUF1488 domain-containing protein [Mesorhizobium sp. CA18]|uniref:DUF1488 domain-containing protein n=1 Tax=unclassified Mesorhizobium TaxID=325217 RepID=UPI001CCCF05D|nr:MULTISPECIES: DUF1488 domain-containing protein [unclassified Mesorhizobium]MBZ9734166.1 DUF1488 domain-containing protein [Mesorhizobium sp. CA9]MBZ9825093.1 DUF1488 domain-containing protein [Mesorhizobium sp. CA18]MBZ9832136.1 DUF1488 domain-containing protein [Mesorhizobium sp. CA2]MBZ9836714.1 DUF1488 domain-containing protein [Mesorhizobium sp. CA3]MBZ9878334.1 DUF1488 domain-containing protein [Mesorhizobium sp. Ca11]